MSEVVDTIFAAFGEAGDELYIGEPVTVADHMLQCAALAQHDRASPELVAAALLHDYGHLVTGEDEDAARRGVDTRHEELAHAYLERWFAPAVTEPIRLHVAAKRYLVAVDPAYLETLSEASLLSLELQGGPMSVAEREAFERGPHAIAACRLRRWDDAGKDPAAVVPPLESYRPLLESLLRG